jgi:hypothetical protein
MPARRPHESPSYSAWQVGSCGHLSSKSVEFVDSIPAGFEPGPVTRVISEEHVFEGHHRLRSKRASPRRSNFAHVLSIRLSLATG